MSTQNIGFRIRTNIDRPAPELVRGFENVPTGNVCDANGRQGAMDSRIKPIEQRMRFVGTAVTVRARPIDNLLVWAALQVARPGDVLVVATGDCTTSSVFGDHLAAVARALGIAAIVTDGMARDAAGLRKVGLPAFTRGLNPNGPHKDGPGEINFPISCGGLPVHPGDLLVGDEDGVVVVPREDVPAVLANLQGVLKKEAQMSRDFAEGRLIPAWVEEALAAKKVEIL